MKIKNIKLIILYMFSSFCIINAQNIKLKGKIKQSKEYIKINNLNENYAIFIDMSLHSGKYRFFLWDFNRNKIIHKSLSAHGYGKNSTQEKPVFSNEYGSLCTSLGRYKIGIKSYSKWGINIHYKLFGLEKTNNNAYKRIIVLHSFNPMESKEIYPRHIPLGWSQGCPVVDNKTMNILNGILSKQKNVLLWIYI